MAPRAPQIKKLITEINTQFYSFKKSQDILLNNTAFANPNADNKKKKDSLNKKCEEISKSRLLPIVIGTKNSRFLLQAFPSYEKFRRKKEKGEERTVCGIVSEYGEYTISTDLYIGVINLGNGLQLEIQTGYSNILLQRMLRYCLGYYADTNISDSASSSHSIYALMTQFMFLDSLKKVFTIAIPKKYNYIKDRSYNIRGNIDIQNFVARDLIAFDKKISYIYPQRVEIKPIIDVLHEAIKKCIIDGVGELSPDAKSYELQLKSLSSGRKPSKTTVNNILKEKCLNNSLYDAYKRPLQLAQMLLKDEDLDYSEDSNRPGTGSQLIDASFLWELYLYNLMKLNLNDNWEISAQSEIHLYENAFFSKTNYPDFVLKNSSNGDIYILDAKFKKMNFKPEDVDNKDLQQLHSYSYYYYLQYGDRFKGAGLIYPSKEDSPANTERCRSILGLEDSSARFCIFSIKDVDVLKSENIEELRQNEQIFIDDLESFIEPNN